ncbi:MAG: AAA family ATPase [Mangrovibacterium sp.]
MSNYLTNYLNKRMEEKLSAHIPSRKPAGPVITISRETGCGGLKISRELAAELNKSCYSKPWLVISKEVLSESAQELKMDPEKVKRLMKLDQHFTFEEILSAFSDKYYKSNRAIMKTVRGVIRNFAMDGCSIILGRGGHIIAGDLKNSLHVRLIAPLEWRTESLTVRKGCTKEEAMQYIRETDVRRENLHRYFIKDKTSEERYDLTIDVSRFPDGSVACIIARAFESKGVGEKFLDYPES